MHMIAAYLWGISRKGLPLCKMMSLQQIFFDARQGKTPNKCPLWGGFGVAKPSWHASYADWWPGSYNKASNVWWHWGEIDADGFWGNIFVHKLAFLLFNRDTRQVSFFISTDFWRGPIFLAHHVKSGLLSVVESVIKAEIHLQIIIA